MQTTTENKLSVVVEAEVLHIGHATAVQSLLDSQPLSCIVPPGKRQMSGYPFHSQRLCRTAADGRTGRCVLEHFIPPGKVGIMFGTCLPFNVHKEW